MLLSATQTQLPQRSPRGAWAVHCPSWRLFPYVSNKVDGRLLCSPGFTQGREPAHSRCSVIAGP